MALIDAKGLFMDAKVKPNQTITQQKKRIGANYLQELKEELKKISWTTKEELQSCTKITVGATFIFGIGIYLADLFIKGVLMTFENLFILIFG